MKNTLKLSAIALLAAMLVAAPAGAVSLNLGGGGPLLDLGGGSDTNAVVDLDSGAGSGGGTTASIGLDGAGSNGIIDFDGSGELIDLSGDDELINLGRSGPTTARIGTGGAGDSGVLLNLFGPGDDANAALNLGAGDDVFIDLFGPGGGSAPGTGGTGAGAGGNGGAGGAGGNGVGIGTGARGNGVLVASLGADAGCFSPNASQIGNLVNRHAYTAATLSDWASARNMQIVQVGLCAEARQRVASTLAADANIGRLHNHLNGSAAIRAGLSQGGHSAGDVIAVDRSGSTLIVYVI